MFQVFPLHLWVCWLGKSMSAWSQENHMHWAKAVCFFVIELVEGKDVPRGGQHQSFLWKVCSLFCLRKHLMALDWLWSLTFVSVYWKHWLSWEWGEEYLHQPSSRDIGIGQSLFLAMKCMHSNNNATISQTSTGNSHQWSRSYRVGRGSISKAKQT